MIGKFRTTLAQPLREGDTTVTSIKVQSIKTQEGDTISMSDFPFGNVGYLVIDPENPNAEIIKFTGIDAANNAFTGITRGLPFHLKTGQEETTVPANVKQHSVGAEVIITDNPQWFYRIKRYIDQAVTGGVGNASETTAGIVFTDKPVLTNKPRVKAVEVHEQSTPNMTVRVEPFVFVEKDFVINWAGGDSPTFTAPTTNPRIDLLVYNTNTNQLEIRQGIESPSPTIPLPREGDFVLSAVYLRPGSTKITDKDITTDAYIYKSTIENFIPNFFKFGGDGSDGDLIITSDTTTIDLGGAKIFVKNYRNLEISGTGALRFINPHNDGTLIIFRVRGDCKLTSTANPIIDLRLLGGASNRAFSPIMETKTFYTRPPNVLYGVGGASAINPPPYYLNVAKIEISSYSQFDANIGTFSASGGRGGGGLLIEVGNNFIGNASSVIDARGENGYSATGTAANNGTSAQSFFIRLIGANAFPEINMFPYKNFVPFPGGGGQTTFVYSGSGTFYGGGGGGGSVLILVNGTITGSLTFNVSGGTSGTGANYKGADGIGLILKNRWFL